MTRPTLKLISALALLAVSCLESGEQAEPSTPAPPEALLALLKTGGEGMLPSNFDLTRPGAGWKSEEGKSRMEFEPLYPGLGYYRIIVDPQKKIRAVNWSTGTIGLKPNRSYRLSALINTDFDRADIEVNAGLIRFAGGRPLPGRRGGGFPAKTVGPGGWQRWEWELQTDTSDLDDRARANLALFVYTPANAHKKFEVRIMDFRVYELPSKPLVPFAAGEGAELRGGPGTLPLRVESPEVGEGIIRVPVTAADYLFDLRANRVTLRQRIDFPRTLSTFTTSLSLEGLRVLRRDDTVCVLGNDELTVGIQCDGVAIFVPHRSDLNFDVESRFRSQYTRFARGHLLTMDGFGGFTVNPHIPLGTGRLVRCEPVPGPVELRRTEDFDTESAQPLDAGWKVRWKAAPGERIFVSAFPSRPFDWEKSFHHIWAWSQIERKESFYHTESLVNDWGLWNFAQRNWGMSFQDDYTPRDESLLRKHMEWIHARKKNAFAYVSAWFHQRHQAEVFLGAVKEWKERYGIDGIYSDGLPAPDWLCAYEEMRMLRELFPKGTLVIHDSFAQSGRAESQMMPFTYAYATSTLMGESTRTRSGEHWVFPRYVGAQFRVANCIGVMKGDRWEGLDGEIDKDLVNLVWGGRARNTHPAFGERYQPLLRQLEALWKEYGSDPYFFDRYYHPEAQRLTGYRIGRAGMPVIKSRQKRKHVAVSAESRTSGAIIKYGLDDGPITSSYTTPLKLRAGQKVRFQAIAEGLEESPVTAVYVASGKNENFIIREEGEVPQVLIP